MILVSLRVQTLYKLPLRPTGSLFTNSVPHTHTGSPLGSQLEFVRPDCNQVSSPPWCGHLHGRGPYRVGPCQAVLGCPQHSPQRLFTLTCVVGTEHEFQVGGCQTPIDGGVAGGRQSKGAGGLSVTDRLAISHLTRLGAPEH